jgi:dipeptidyl aminopeptidase/acylaminoacyl peptidase
VASLPGSVAPALLIALALLAPAPLAAQRTDRFTLEDLGRMRTPAATAISPDGRLVAYTLITPDSLGLEHVQGIWVVGTVRTAGAAGGGPVRLAARGSTPRWSPDGRQVAYLSGDGLPGRVAQIMITPATGGERRRLTSSATPVRDFAWSPDGARIAFVATVTERGAARPQIHVLDVAAGTARQLTRLERTIIVSAWDADANLSWSPDGTRIAFSAKPTPKFDDDYESDIYEVAVHSGDVRALVQRPGMDMRPVWSPDGALIAFRSSYGEVDRFADHGISLVSPEGGTPRDVGKAFAGGFLDGPYQYAWSADSRTLLFTGAEPLATAIFAVDARSGRTRRLTGTGGQRSGLSVASRASRMAFIMSEATTPWEVYVSEVASYGPRRLTRSNPHLDQRRLASSEAVRWKSGAWDLTGVLVRPVGRSASAPRPLIVVLHGGPEGSGRLGFEPELPHPSFNYDGGPHPAQLYAARGYAVFFPNFRGSGGHGRALRRAGSTDWSRTFFDDVMAGLDTLVRRGIADSTRLFVVGSRSGATKVVSLLTNTARFRAAYVHNPYPDLVAEYGKSSDDFHLMYHGLYGGSPEAVPEVYERESPINAAARISTPTQIVADEDAVNIPASQSLLLHRRLLERGVRGELMLFRGRDIPATLEALRRNLAWFDRWAAAR